MRAPLSSPRRAFSCARARPAACTSRPEPPAKRCRTLKQSACTARLIAHSSSARSHIFVTADSPERRPTSPAEPRRQASQAAALAMSGQSNERLASSAPPRVTCLRSQCCNRRRRRIKIAGAAAVGLPAWRCQLGESVARRASGADGNASPNERTKNEPRKQVGAAASAAVERQARGLTWTRASVSSPAWKGWAQLVS